MKTVIKSRLLIISTFYLMLMSVVWIVALAVGDFVKPQYLLTHFFGFIAAFAILFVVVDRFTLPDIIPYYDIDYQKYNWMLVAAPAGLLATYFTLLGNIPLFDAIEANEYYAVTKIRTDISKAGFPESYIPALLTRSIAPTIVIYFLQANKFKSASLVFFFSAAVGLLTITKGHVIFASLPIIVYCVLTKRFLQAGLFMISALIIIYSVMIVTNPATKTPCNFSGDTADPACRAITETAPTVDRLTGSLIRRALFVPGQVVAEWFEIFPEKVAFERGCGYRFMAPILGCEFRQNARLVYAIQYPDRAAQGILGNKNAAHFMEEYANFGLPGLFLAGALAASIMGVATLFTSTVNLPAFLALNLTFILMMTSTALHTTLLSGGWLVAILTSAVLIGNANMFSTRQASSQVKSTTSKSA